MIQDYIFALGSLVLTLSLVPMCLHADTVVPRKSSIPTAVVLWVYAATFYTLGFYLSLVTTSLTALLWSYIALEKYECRY